MVVFVFFLFSIFLYLYFVSSIIINVIETKNTRVEMQTLNASVAELEQGYLLENNFVNLELGRKLGFKDPKNTYFATREEIAVRP